MRKMQTLILSLLIFMVFMLIGCTDDKSNNREKSDNSSSKNITLDFMTNSPEHVLDAYKEVAKKYEEENDSVTIQVTSQAEDFESLMKAKMAANDLPDLWLTHGWSVERYSDYLEVLNEQPWFDKIVDPLLPTISNTDGEIFVLPLDVDQSGVVINEDVLKEVNVDPDKLDTWDDFLDAFEKIKEIGKTPVGIGGKDPRTFARLLDFMASPMLIASESNDYSEELLDGTFDWSKWGDLSQLLVDLHENEYLNKDALTASSDVIEQGMAQNEIGFIFDNNQMITSVLELNADANIGFIPLPAIYPDGHKVLIGGERNAVGVWKDSENKEEALKFLEFLSQEENMKLVASAQGMQAAFKDVQIDFGHLTRYFEKYEDIEIEPYFDRVYLPSGMWSTLQTIGSGLVSGNVSIEESIEIMQEDYHRLRSESEE